MVEAKVKLDTGLYTVYVTYDRKRQKILSAAFSPSGTDVFDGLPAEVRASIEQALTDAELAPAPVEAQQDCQVIQFPRREQ